MFSKTSFLIYVIFVLFPEQSNKPKYIVSKMGKFMLTHQGAKYTQSSAPVITVVGSKTRWRCTYMSNGRYACRAKAQTYLDIDGVETVEYDGQHCHGPVS